MRTVDYIPGRDPIDGWGGHALSVADVDGDGKDEIVYQAMTIDDDGKGLYSTGRRHGDALHVGDFDPSRPGLELYLITENEEDTVKLQTPGAGMHDARTGKLLWSHSPGGLRTVKGRQIGAAPRPADWVIWWDGDLLREIYGGFSVFKWNPEAQTAAPIFSAAPPAIPVGRGRHMGMRPNLAADLLGDWREEVLLPGPDGKSMRLYTTTIPTSHRLTTLMHDPQYRLSIAWQNVSYNKPPHTSYFLGEGMEQPASPAITDLGPR